MDYAEDVLKYSYLEGKKIVLGVSGGISAYKSVELLRMFQKAGADVQVVMTKTATKFVSEWTFESLTGKKVYVEFEGMEHIYVPHSADLFVVAPATANIIGKFANGICDTMLSTMLIATTCPVVIVPSMNWAMLKNPAVSENIKKISERNGYIVVEPEEGDLACGERGEGKFPHLEKIFFWCEYALAPKKFCGKRAVVTAGPTKEFIDDVRYISNPSSGLMGYLVAREIALSGAQTYLVSGADIHFQDINCFAGFSKVVSAEDMLTEVEKLLPADIFVGAAAVSDFRPKVRIKGKVKKESVGDEVLVEFIRNPDIVNSVRQGVKILIGFALESEDILNNALCKLKSKNVDLIVANDIRTFGKSESEFIIIDKENVESPEKVVSHKRIVARKIVERIAEKMEKAEKCKDIKH